jgi:hypothetical protein
MMPTVSPQGLLEEAGRRTWPVAALLAALLLLLAAR